MFFMMNVACLAVTNVDLSGSSGDVASPLYPLQYPHNVDFTWTITVPVGNVIRVEFTSFDLEGPMGSLMSRCRWDYLLVCE